VLTAIEDQVSRAVREQYEEMPYPRWVKAALIDLRCRSTVICAASSSRAFRPLGEPAASTSGRRLRHGKHPIETAKRYTNAQVLAVDLSSAVSAMRGGWRVGRPAEHRICPGDISIGATGRSFDVIESVGVLHHLATRRPVGVCCCRCCAGGLMLVGLYSRPLGERSHWRAISLPNGHRPYRRRRPSLPQELIALPGR